MGSQALSEKYSEQPTDIPMQHCPLYNTKYNASFKTINISRSVYVFISKKKKKTFLRANKPPLHEVQLAHSKYGDPIKPRIEVFLKIKIKPRLVVFLWPEFGKE